MEIIGFIICILLLASPFIAFEIYKRKIKIFNKGVMSFKESLDLTNLPIVTFTSGDKKYNFLLDTGASGSVINKDTLKDITYNSTGDTTDIFGMEGNAQTAEIVEIWLTYKDKSFKEQFQAADLSKAFDLLKKEYGVNIHGILGSLFFKKFKYILDFSELIAYSTI